MILFLRSMGTSLHTVITAVPLASQGWWKVMFSLCPPLWGGGSGPMSSPGGYPSYWFFPRSQVPGPFPEVLQSEVPQARTGWGNPWSGLDGVSPIFRTGWGTPMARTGWHTSPGQDWMGYLPDQDRIGYPPPSETEQQSEYILATWRAVCPLRSRRRTVLPKLNFAKSVSFIWLPN